MFISSGDWVGTGSALVSMLRVEQAAHSERPELTHLPGSCDSGSNIIDLFVHHLENTRLDFC